MPRRIPIRIPLTGAALAAAGAAGLPDTVRQAGTMRSKSLPVEIGTWSKAACEAAGKPAVQHAPGENSIDGRNQFDQGRIDAAAQGSGTLPYARSNKPGRYHIIGAPFTVRCQGISLRQESAAQRAAVTAVWIGTGEQIAASSPRQERGPA